MMQPSSSRPALPTEEAVSVALPSETIAKLAESAKIFAALDQKNPMTGIFKSSMREVLELKSTGKCATYQQAVDEVSSPISQWIMRSPAASVIAEALDTANSIGLLPDSRVAELIENPKLVFEILDAFI